MAAQTEKVAPHSAQSEIHSIEFLTENGYSIVRLAQSEGANAIDYLRHEFLVTSPDGFQRRIHVEIRPGAVTQIYLQTRGRISATNSFWTYCGERHLAEYIANREHLPPNEELIVDQLTPKDLNLSIRWETT